jgi:protein-disulfide isomerase
MAWKAGLAILVVAGIVAVVTVIVTAYRPPSNPANMASDGIVIGAGFQAQRSAPLPPDAEPRTDRAAAAGSTVRIRIYTDYLCAACAQFEATNGAQIAKLVDSGAVTLEIHPISLLSGLSAGTKYSLRAANAAVCVADKSPNRFYRYHRALFAHQPKESSPGLTDGQLMGLAKSDNIDDAEWIRRCIDDGYYAQWVRTATSRVVAGPVPDSDLKPARLRRDPLIIVNGKHYAGSLTDVAQFKAFILQASGESYQASNRTPLPTPTSTTLPTPTLPASAEATPSTK